MNFLNTLGLLGVVCMMGCSKPTVRVITDTGKPVQNAKVFAVSLSMNTGPSITNAKGEASLPSNIQGLKWVKVEKAGFKTIQVPISKSWPLIITLKKKPSL